MNGLALRLRNVVKEYPGDVHALRGVSVEVPSGDRVAVVGPSGSGKTTMLTVLGTLERPTSGEVEVAGGVDDAVGHAHGVHGFFAGLAKNIGGVWKATRISGTSRSASGSAPFLRR